MESSITSTPHTTVAKKMLRMLMVVCGMIRKGVIPMQKLTMDLHHLLKRWKLAGKAVAKLTSFDHHHNDSSYYNPGEVEFSCSNTPSYPHFHLNKRRHRRYSSYDYEAVAAIADALEMLNNEIIFSDAESIPTSIAPSPMIVGFGKSPRVVRQLRVTDSPYPPINEDEVADDGRVDKEADAFIRRFYEQLKFQQKTAVATPDYKLR